MKNNNINKDPNIAFNKLEIHATKISIELSKAIMRNSNLANTFVRS